MVIWKLPVFNADAQKCYEEISKLKTITPENILCLAENEDSELHKCFEWNNEVAAEKYRLSQARKILQLMVVRPSVDDEIQTPVRVFHISSKTSVYEPFMFFVKNKDEYELLLQRAIKELYAFKEKYASLAELKDIMAVIDKFQMEEK